MNTYCYLMLLTACYQLRQGSGEVGIVINDLQSCCVVHALKHRLILISSHYDNLQGDVMASRGEATTPGHTRARVVLSNHPRALILAHVQCHDGDIVSVLN